MNHINLRLSKLSLLSPNLCKKDDSYLLYLEVQHSNTLWGCKAAFSKKVMARKDAKQKQKRAEKGGGWKRTEKVRLLYLVNAQYSCSWQRLGADPCMCWHLKRGSEPESLFFGIWYVKKPKKGFQYHTWWYDRRCDPCSLWKVLNCYYHCVYSHISKYVPECIKMSKCSIKDSLSLSWSKLWHNTVCVCVCEVCIWPPPIVLQITEGAVDKAGCELSSSDEEGVNGHQLTPEVGRRGLSDVHGHCHRSNTCNSSGEGETAVSMVSRRCCFSEDLLSEEIHLHIWTHQGL